MSPSTGHSKASSSTSTASKYLLRRAAGSEPRAQVSHRQPHPLRPRTSPEDKACADGPALGAGCFRKAVGLTSAPASAGSRQERGEALSGADSETKPAGARWESSGSGTAESGGGAGAEGPGQPRGPLLPGGISACPSPASPGGCHCQREPGELRGLRCPCRGSGHSLAKLPCSSPRGMGVRIPDLPRTVIETAQIF